MDPRNRQRTRPRMSLEQRAKIFMPFDALKGLREALHEKELEAAERYDDIHDVMRKPL